LARTGKCCFGAASGLAFELRPPASATQQAHAVTLVRSLIWYADHYKNDQLKTFVFPNGRVGLEMSFSFELPFSPQGSNDHYYYSGHIDKLATYNGLLYVVERKHTTGSLGSQFFDRYTFSSQVSGYVFAGKVVFESPVQGAIIDATAVAVNSSSFGRAS
jgi:hypothetical protein